MVIYMESLYAVSISGTMLYVKGSLSEEECIAVEKIAAHTQNISDNPAEFEVIYQAFIDAVETSLHISLVRVPLKCVFRIK